MRLKRPSLRLMWVKKPGCRLIVVSAAINLNLFANHIDARTDCNDNSCLLRFSVRQSEVIFLISNRCFSLFLFF